MTRFYGPIGYGESIETAPGVWVDRIVEHSLSGDLEKNSRRLEGGDRINGEIVVQNSISVVADAYAMEHIFAIRYVMWQGARWTVSEVTVQPPRLILRLGRVYNGPTP